MSPHLRAWMAVMLTTVIGGALSAAGSFVLDPVNAQLSARQLALGAVFAAFASAWHRFQLPPGGRTSAAEAARQRGGDAGGA